MPAAEHHPITGGSLNSPAIQRQGRVPPSASGIGLYQSHAGGRAPIVAAERGANQVALISGCGGRWRGVGLGGCSSSVGGVVSPNPALKTYFQSHPPNTPPLPLALYTAAELGVGESCHGSLPPLSTRRILAPSWADHPKACPASQLFRLLFAFLRVLLLIVFLTQLRPISEELLRPGR